MKTRVVAVYVGLGCLCGAAAGTVSVWGAPAGAEGIGIRRLVLLAVSGAILALPGGIVERSIRKAAVAALAGALGLAVAGLMMMKVLQIELGLRSTIAAMLALFCGFGALLAIMHALLDETYSGVSYSVIMGANGGLAGVALAFLAINFLTRGRVNWIVGAAIYNAAVWGAIALARMLELNEREDRTHAAQEAAQADLSATEQTRSSPETPDI